MATRQLLGAR